MFSAPEPRTPSGLAQEVGGKGGTRPPETGQGRQADLRQNAGGRKARSRSGVEAEAGPGAEPESMREIPGTHRCNW